MAEDSGMPVDDADDFDFDLDLTETEMWEKKILEVADQAVGSSNRVIGNSSSKKTVSMNDVEELSDDDPDLILSKNDGENNKNKDSAEKRTDSDGMEDLDDIDNGKSSQSPSILDSSDGFGASFATRENSINALRDSLNAFRDAMDTVRESMMKDKKQDGSKNTEKSKDSLKVYEVSESDDEKTVKQDANRSIIDIIDEEEEKAVIVNFYDTIDLTDQGQTDMSSPGEELNTSSSGTMGDEEMNTFVISSSSEKAKSDIQVLARQSQEEKKPTSSASTYSDDTYTNLDVPPCQSCLKAKEKRNCIHRHQPYPLSQSQGQGPGSPGGQGGSRGIGRGALLEQLTQMGVRPASRGRSILSSEWAGLEAVKKESKKLKYSVEVQHVREIFPAVHRHFVKKLLKYLANRFDDRERVLQHVVTFLSENPYPMDGDSQWEIDAAIDSLKKVVITPTGIDIPKHKEHKSSGDRDSFVSNWISQSDFKKALDTVMPSSSLGGNNGNSDGGASESGGAGADADSRLFGFSNPQTLNINLGLPLVPSGTSVRSLGTSIASIANSPPASPLSGRSSSGGSSDDLFGNSPNRISELIGFSSDTSPDSVKQSGAGASSTAKMSDTDKKDVILQKSLFKVMGAEYLNKSPIVGATGTSGRGNQEFSRPSLEQKSDRINPSTNRNTNERSQVLEKAALQEALYASIKPEHSEMEVEAVDSPAVRPKSTDRFKRDQEQFKRAVANYRRLEAKKKAAKNGQNTMIKDGAGGKAVSSSSLVTEGTLRMGDIRPKVTVAETMTIGSGTPRFHPYPQTDKQLSADRKSNSTPEFSFAAPLAGNQPDSVSHGQTVSHPDISSSIKDEDMALEEANLVVSSSSINCENCKATHPVTSLAQCCDGHLLCKACLEKATKLILVGNQSGQVICPVTDCGSSVPRSELRKCLHSIMLDLLDEKWNKEAVDAMNEMEDFVRCPGCSYSVILDLNVKMHCCEQCKKTFCRFCNLHWNVKNHDFCIKMKTMKTADGQGVITIPAHWSLMPDQEEPFQQVIVNDTEVEFTAVAELFYATMKRNMFKVEKVYRIQNQRLWEKYMLMRTHMVADLGEMHINEQRLFHGTSSEVIPAICKEGFDWRLHGRNGTAFGQGTYFARDADYSHNYSTKNGAYSRLSSHHGGLFSMQNQRFSIINQRRSRHQAIPLPSGAIPGHSPATTQPQQSIFHSVSGFGGPQGYGISSTGSQQQSNYYQLGGHGTSNTGFQFGNSNNAAGNQPQQQGVIFGGPGGPPSTQPSWWVSAPPNVVQTGATSTNSGFNFGSSGGFTFGASGSSPRNEDTVNDFSGNFMFVGRVLVGRVCKGTTDMRRPPKDDTDPQKSCHTAVNHTNKPSIFVVFESSQCYPEYLIEYKSQV